MPDTPILEVSGLIAAYGAIRALHGVDLSLMPGEVVAVLGANGAGKTTLLRCLSGLLKPVDGRIVFDGDDIAGKPAEGLVARGISHVPQGRMVFPGLSVRENLIVGGWTRDRAATAQGIDRACTYFPRLAERMDQQAGTLSGGEQQMLAVARGLMSQPRLLMLDEPSMGVAPVIKAVIFDALADIARDEGVTMLIVEQDAELALDLADRGYVLETGSLAVEGPAEALLADDALRRAYLGG
jgi:branched-chain amino acid transport system ATP-binding protein